MNQNYKKLLSDSIWLQLVIENVVAEMQATWEEVTTQDVAIKVHKRGNQLGTTPSDELLGTCDEYLQQYGDPFSGIFHNDDAFLRFGEKGKNFLLRPMRARSRLLKAQAAMLDSYVMDKLGDDASAITPQR
jgi:hypothetical protein